MRSRKRVIVSEEDLNNDQVFKITELAHNHIVPQREYIEISNYFMDSESSNEPLI